MMVKRLALLTGVLLLGLTLSTSAFAERFSVTGGGGQFHIGNGLALPIQQAALGPVNNGSVFPGEAGTAFELLIRPIPGAAVEGSIGNALTSQAGKSAYQNTLSVPPAILQKSGGQTTVGVKFSNDTAIAVGTNLNFSWPPLQRDSVSGQILPNANAVFSTGNAFGGVGAVLGPGGGTMVYSNVLNQRFGGVAQFAITGNSGTGLLDGVTAGAEDSPVTVYITIGQIAGGCCPGAGAVGVVAAIPTGNFGAGGTTTTTVNTPGRVLAPNVAAGAFAGLGGPSGQPLAMPNLVATNTAVPTNAATSLGAPWTTGMIVVKNNDGGSPETFTMTGDDGRTANGAGSIQMVAASVSTRVATGPNGNRGWVQLDLVPIGTTPALGPMAQVALGGLVLLGGAYIARRKLS